MTSDMTTAAASAAQPPSDIVPDAFPDAGSDAGPAAGSVQVGEQSAVRVIRYTETDVATRIREHRDQLRTLCGTENLLEIVADGIGYDLGARASQQYGELTSLGYLAGLDPLPCCSHHDTDRIESWVAAIDRIADTGTL